MTGKAVAIPDRGMGDRGRRDLAAHVAVAGATEPARLLPDQGGIISGMGGMATPALSPGHGLVDTVFPFSPAHVPVTGPAEGAALFRLPEKRTGGGCMQFMTAHAVTLGKGTMQAQPTPFVGLPAMAAETELILGCGEQGHLGGPVRQMAGIAGPAIGRRMGP